MTITNLHNGRLQPTTMLATHSTGTVVDLDLSYNFIQAVQDGPYCCDDDGNPYYETLYLNSP